MKPTWQFFDHLRFLNDHCQARETTSNIPKRDVDGKIADISKDEYQPGSEFIYNVNNPPSEKSRKKWQQSQEDELKTKSLEILSAPPPPQKESNPDMLFGELIGHSLSNIEDKRTKDLVKLQIQQILFIYSHQEASHQVSFINLYHPLKSLIYITG